MLALFRSLNGTQPYGSRSNRKPVERQHLASLLASAPILKKTYRPEGYSKKVEVFKSVLGSISSGKVGSWAWLKKLQANTI
jgi:hypothetical protein